MVTGAATLQREDDEEEDEEEEREKESEEGAGVEPACDELAAEKELGVAAKRRRTPVLRGHFLAAG
jgi:hypothetical protein